MYEQSSHTNVADLKWLVVNAFTLSYWIEVVLTETTGPAEYVQYRGYSVNASLSIWCIFAVSYVI